MKTLRLNGSTIGCYLHISPDYRFDGWMIDFKTGEKRMAARQAANKLNRTEKTL
jgi:hypothetical protein